MNIEIFPPKYPINWEIPKSKSVANRLLILAANGFFKSPFLLRDIPKSQDVIELLTAIKLILPRYRHEQDTFVAESIFPQDEILSNNDIVLGPFEGGTSARFLLVLLSLGKNCYVLKLKESLAKRPWDELLQSLVSLGAKVKKAGCEIWIQGPITPPAIPLRFRDSSQFASAFLLCNIPAIDDGPYFSLTQKIMEQKITEIPVDMSSLTTALTYSLLTTGGKINALTLLDRHQPDYCFFDFLKNWNIDFDYRTGIIPKGVPLSGYEFDAHRAVDLVPTLMVFSAFAKSGVAVFHHLNRLQTKESRRLDEILKLFHLFEISYQLQGDMLYLPAPQRPFFKPLPIHYRAPSDHRMVFMASILMAAGSGGTIENWQAVAKSFPGWFDCILQ